MPTVPKTWRLASMTKAFPGPKILSHPRDCRGAEGKRSDRLRASDTINFGGAALGESAQARRFARIRLLPVVSRQRFLARRLPAASVQVMTAVETSGAVPPGT